MTERSIKTSVADKNLLQNFKKMATEQQSLADITFDEIYVLQNNKDKFIIGQKTTTERIEKKSEDVNINSHLQSRATYFIAPLKKGEIQTGTIITAKSNEKYDYDTPYRWGTQEAETEIAISRNNQRIYSFSTKGYNPLDNLDVIKDAINKQKRISDQWKHEHSLPGKITKLTRDTSQKIGKQVGKFKQKSLKSKFLIAAAALTPVALTAADPEITLAALGGSAVFATAGAAVAGVGTVGVAGCFYTAELYNKIKSFAKDAKEKGIKTIVQTKIQEAKKRMAEKKKEQAKEKKLSHTEALAWLAIAEPTQVNTEKLQTKISNAQRDIFR